MHVMCTESIYTDKTIRSFAQISKHFNVSFSDLDDISNRIDFIICLGGDGTLLYASSLFQVSGQLFLLPLFFSLYWYDTTVPLLCLSAGERSTSYGLSPGLPGIPDSF